MIFLLALPGEHDSRTPRRGPSNSCPQVQGRGGSSPARERSQCLRSRGSLHHPAETRLFTQAVEQCKQHGQGHHNRTGHLQGEHEHQEEAERRQPRQTEQGQTAPPGGAVEPFRLQWYARRVSQPPLQSEQLELPCLRLALTSCILPCLQSTIPGVSAPFRGARDER